MQVDCKTEIIFSSSAKHICCAWLFSAYSAIRSRVSSTAPAWRTALYLALYHYSFHYFFLDFSTTRGATCRPLLRQMVGDDISIHAPLAGCDFVSGGVLTVLGIFQSTHPLRGATSKAGMVPSSSQKFQTTHPLRGATRLARSRDRRRWHFNPRTPCGVRPAQGRRDKSEWKISIHAPLAGCDIPQGKEEFFPGEFQSTHPLRGATTYFRLRFLFVPISIHAPLAGCDCAIDLLSYATLEFQSTHPSRGATPKVDLAACPFPFQSTHPSRGATPRLGAGGVKSTCVRRLGSP